MTTVIVVKHLPFGNAANSTSDEGTPASVDYRLARNATLRAWRAGQLARHHVCDAQFELIRNATYCGQPTERLCPVCSTSDIDTELVEVTYVFGWRLPRHGRCITSAVEIERLQARAQPSKAYVVEVCTRCGWNHLMRHMVLGGVSSESSSV